jgi:hypothetical protein
MQSWLSVAAMTAEFDRQAAAHEIHVEEYKWYRTEMTRLSKAAADIDRYGIIAIAAIYTWLFSRASSTGWATPFVGHAQWVPVLISVVVLLRIRSSIITTRRIRDYLFLMEEAYWDDDIARTSADTRWRDWRDAAHERRLRRSRWDRLGISRTWCTLLAATLVIGILSEVPPFSQSAN